MKLNIENCAKNGSEGTKAWALDELVRNLKEMRDRSNAGDMQAAVTEFFEVFRFSDNQMDPSPIRAAVEAAQPEAVGEQIMALAHRWAQATYCKALGQPFEDFDAIQKEMRSLFASAPTPTESQPAEADERSEREAFEAWANEDFYSGLADIGDTWNEGRENYTDFAHHMAFHAWQARALSAPTAPAQAEPVHWRALLDPAQRPHKLQTRHHVVGFTSYKACEEFVASELDMNGWRYTIEPLYNRPACATPPTAASDAERLDAERWRAFIGLDYEFRAEWATNLSLAPVLTKWVDNRIDYLRAEERK